MMRRPTPRDASDVADLLPQFTRAMRVLVPDLPAEAVVFELDCGSPADLSICLVAGIIEDGALVGDPIERLIAASWLREFLEADAQVHRPALEIEI
jgi:hypothetical protein